MSLPFMLLTSQMERRKLLIGLFVVFIASHVLSFMAWNFTVLVISRVGIAFAHAVFWSITASLAIRLAPAKNAPGAEPDCHRNGAGDGVRPADRAHCGSILRLAHHLLCHRHGALITRCLIKLLPKLPSEHSGSLKSLPLLMRRPALMSIYLLTVIVVTAHYTAYSYIEPFVQVVAGFSANFATVLLLIRRRGDYRQHPVREAGQSACVCACKQCDWPAAGMSAVTDACGRQRESSGDPQSVLGRGDHDYWSGNAGQSAGAGPGRHGRSDVALLRDFNLGIGAGALVGNQISLHVSMSAIGYLGRFRR